MPKSVVAIVDHRRDHWLIRRSGRKRLRIAGASALAFVAVVIGLAQTLPTPARAGPEPKPGPEPQRGNPQAPSTFFTESHEALKEMREALSGIAVRLLAGIVPDVGQDVDIASQRLVVEAANAQVQAAKGACELAQLALKEYQEGTVKQEQATLEEVLALAQDELKHATRKIEQAIERNAKVQAASTGSAYDLSQEHRFKLGIELTKGEVGNPDWKVKLARQELKDFREYRIASRTKELTSEIEKARSDELAKTATWEREQSRLRKMQRALSDPPLLTDHQKRMLTILDAAIPIEEQLNKKLAECEKAGDASESLRKELNALAGRLAVVVEEGRDEEADAALATLSRNVRQSSTFVAIDFGRASLPAQRAGAELPAASTDTVPVSSSLVESRRSLRNLKYQILTVARQAMETGDAMSRSQADIRDAAINQEITVKSAAALYENARLKREVAEIGVNQYEEGIFLQDRAAAEREVKLDESDVSSLTDWVKLLKDQLAKIRTASDGLIDDLLVEFSFEDEIGEAELTVTRARITVAKPHLSNLELLLKFTKPKRIKELQIAVEKARATELTRQAQWEREKLKLAKLKEAVKKQNGQPSNDRVQALLSRSLSIVDELKPRLERGAKDPEPSEAARKEIADLIAQLRAIVAQMPAAMAADQWSALKPKVHEAVARYLQPQSKVEKTEAK